MLTVSEDVLRTVLAADVPSDDVVLDPDDLYGQVTVTRLAWSAVTALFADEAAAESAIVAARAAATGHSLTDALELPGIEALLDDHDLLWFAPEELDALP